MAHLGYVGLGAMGGLMAERLMAKGHTVTGYNRTRSKAQGLIDKGMKWGDSPRAVAEAGDVTFVMVTNSAALEAVANGPDGLLAGLGAGKLLIDMSTVSPAVSRALAAKVRDKGAEMVDAPVSGSVITLQQGKLSVMVGGEKSAFDRAKPLLDDVGPRVTHVGENGLALSMKIAINLSLAVQMLAFSEGVLLAEKSGIARETAVDVMTHSVIASPMVQYRGPLVLNMPDEAWFDVNMMQKDMLLALEMGRQLDVPLPTTAVTNEMLTAARGMGLAKKDFAVICSRCWPVWQESRNECRHERSRPAPRLAQRLTQLVCSTCTSRWSPSACSRSGSTTSTPRALMPGLAHLYIGEEAIAVGICEALHARRLHHEHAPRPRPLPGQRRDARPHVRGAPRQGGRVLQRQGRLDAHRRPRHRQPRRQRDRRRQRRHRHRRRVASEDRPGGGLLLRRGRARTGLCTRR